MDAAATDKELDEKEEGEAAALVIVAPRRVVGSREVGSREVGSRGPRERARTASARSAGRRPSRGAFALADAAATDEKPDEKAEGRS